MTATTTTHQPGDRVTWTSRHTHETYTGTVNGPFVADQVSVEQDPQPEDTHRATWHIPASGLRPIDEPTAPAAPMMLGHLPKQPRRTSGKVGRFDSPARRRDVLTRLATRANIAARVITAADYLRSLGADTDTVTRFSSPFGKKVRAAFVSARNTEPALAGWDARGQHLVRCLAYGPGDTEILRDATAGYGRVSHLLNGAS